MYPKLPYLSLLDDVILRRFCIIGSNRLAMDLFWGMGTRMYVNLRILTCAITKGRSHILAELAGSGKVVVYSSFSFKGFYYVQIVLSGLVRFSSY